MNKQSKWTLAAAVTGVAIAAVLVLAFDMTVSNAMIFVGLWIIAAAALRILLDYLRVRREAAEPTDTTD